jgi:hypothetical protein
MGPARVHDVLSSQETCQGKNDSEGTVYEGQEGQHPRDGMWVRKGIYHHFFLPERHRREENECLHGVGHLDEVRQSLGVPGCGFRGGVCHL